MSRAPLRLIGWLGSQTGRADDIGALARLVKAGRVDLHRPEAAERVVGPATFRATVDRAWAELEASQAVRRPTAAARRGAPARCEICGVVDGRALVRVVSNAGPARLLHRACDLRRRGMTADQARQVAAGRILEAHGWFDHG